MFYGFVIFIIDIGSLAGSSYTPPNPIAVNLRIYNSVNEIVEVLYRELRSLSLRNVLIPIFLKANISWPDVLHDCNILLIKYMTKFLS